MKNAIIFILATIGAIVASISFGISINVDTGASKPVKVKHNYCKPGKTKCDGNRKYICSSNGEWTRAGVCSIKKPNVKVRTPSISY